MVPSTYWLPCAQPSAIGDTPAVCLTRDLPPELPANILSLGPTDDAYNVLYTVYVGLGARMYYSMRFYASHTRIVKINLLPAQRENAS
ncbi:hypothetical protein AMATHDRAFT_68368 [Amanita thiersii Skay4041]|uniref:Uncharacterized protein n=1 Tax=Amanita thiersii Skay4041 TaxID=703135 RepID=A0A2A9NFT8_9AGAR|nr:hypothetical protein AMATHDRAFT_68368 [Amanita thiersii Skay4041]